MLDSFRLSDLQGVTTKRTRGRGLESLESQPPGGGPVLTRTPDKDV